MACLIFNDDDIFDINENTNEQTTQYKFVCPLGGEIELTRIDNADQDTTITFNNIKCAHCCKVLDNDCDDVLLTLEPQGICAYQNTLHNHV